MEIFTLSDLANLRETPVNFPLSGQISVQNFEILDVLKNSQFKEPTGGAG